MNTGAGDVLWTPSAERAAAALVSQFRRRVNERLGLELGDHQDLHRWSVRDRAAFWGAVWEFAGVVGDGPGAAVVTDGDLMPGARWFTGARLNFAENLLQGPAEAEALVFGEKTGTSGA